MSEVQVRALRPSETAALAQMLFDAYDDDYPREVWDRVVRDQARHQGRTICAFVGDQPVSTAFAGEYSMRIGGEIVPIGAIANVATRPDMRKRGLAEKVLRRAGAVMREAGYTLSILITPVPEYYDRFGYHAIPETRFRIETAGPSGGVKTSAHIERCDPAKHLDGVRALHESWSTRLTGPCPRSRREWTSPSLWEPDDPERFLVAMHDGEVVAYLRGRQGKPRIVTEFAASDSTAGAALLARSADVARAAGEPCLRGQFPLGDGVVEELRRAGIAAKEELALGPGDGFEITMLSVIDLPGFFNAFVTTPAARLRVASIPGDVSITIESESAAVAIACRGGALTTTIPDAPSLKLTDAEMVELITGARPLHEMGLAGKLDEQPRALLSALFPHTGFVLWPADHF